MTVTFHALALLCALGAVILATAARSTRDLAALTVGFAGAAVVASPLRLPDPVVVGLLAAAAPVVVLFRPRYAVVGPLMGGTLAGLWTALLEVQGLPSVAASLLGAALVVLPLRLARSRPAFAPDAMREEALLALVVLGLGVAMLPGVLDGWQAAATLAGPVADVVPPPVPFWTASLLLTALLVGALYSVWSRR